jgi:pimeloyl-ACP methyl ester carboxylesterase
MLLFLAHFFFQDSPMASAESLYKSPAAYRQMMAHYDTSLAAWPVPYETQYVETRHGRTHVIICGRADAPPLMMFHGWAANASAAYGEYDIKRLGESFRLYLPDTIGQTGRSDPQRPSKDGPAYSEWTSDVINGLGIDTLYLMGISGGGYLSLKAASVLGERVLGALIMCSAGITKLQLMSRRFLLGGVPATLWPSERTGLGFVKAMMTPNREILPAHRDMARGMAFLFKTHRFQSGPTPLTDRELTRITAPVKLLLAADDVFVNAAKTAARAQQLMARVDIEIIPKCGHMMTIDRPGLAEERLISLVTRLLDKAR